MKLTRRDLMKFMLAAGVAEAAIDWEQLLWTPKPIITVPAMPQKEMNYLISSVEYDAKLTAIAHKFARDRGVAVFPDLREQRRNLAHARTTLVEM